ncbi:hypothetical protein Clacol_001423 [Clathrus columnatus]|uniref:Uncharacterized protein n=1 Tax=Clathrus columnatus TaxID=1419009 RepID=A0AAV5A1X4_9AGAM|nr:hypothetical protein Clacol_001423 [Clathrus columnatus]
MTVSTFNKRAQTRKACRERGSSRDGPCVTRLKLKLSAPVSLLRPVTFQFAPRYPAHSAHMLRPRPLVHKQRNTPPSSSSRTSPPPPYVNDDGLFFDKPVKNIDTSDPIRATAMMLGVQLDTDPEISPTIIAQIAEKSREELANLFLEAEKVIRAREAELALAANLGKTLLETNQAMKSRYDALLARLPVSWSTSSPNVNITPTPTFKAGGESSPDGDQWTTDEEVSFQILSNTPSPVRSRANSSATLDNHLFPTHQRRISASPAALMALQETNNELIAELTRLRSETDSAQVEGADRLQKLEREIKGLKAELETTQRTNSELEERMHAHRLDEQRILYEERVKKLRQRRTSEPQGNNTFQENKDFAPPPELRRTVRRASSINLSEHLEDFESNCPNYEESIASAAPSVHSSFSAISANEYAVVAQLYSKVEELQTANRELAARNRTTQEHLSRAERNALEIKKVYDTIRAELGSDADTDADVDSSSSDDDNHVKGITPKASMRSIRHVATRSADRIDSIRSRKDSKAKKAVRDIDKTITPYGSSTSRAIGNKNMLNATRLAKTRKPLSTSLFVPLSGSSISPKSLPCSRSSSPIPTDCHASLTPRSQTPIPGSRKKKSTTNRTPVTVQRTLGSELGNDSNFMNLGHLSNLDSSDSIYGSKPRLSLSDDDDDLPAVAELRRLLDEDELLNSISPDTSAKSIKHSISLNSPRSPKAARQTRDLSTLPRFPSTVLDSSTSSLTLAQRRISRREDALMRMVSMRENEFLSVTRAVVQSLTENPLGDESDGEDQDHFSSAPSTPPKGVLGLLRRQSGDVMLELWLYLQFIVVIGFFLYTMAKRGPRDVMGLPPRRTTR